LILARDTAKLAHAMQRLDRDYYQPHLPRQHENKMQELRHERKSESLRLDGLKKALESKLSAALRQTNPGRAA